MTFIVQHLGHLKWCSDLSVAFGTWEQLQKKKKIITTSFAFNEISKYQSPTLFPHALSMSTLS